MHRAAKWQIMLALLAFVQVVATFTASLDRLYVAKWLAGVAILGCYFALGRCKVSTALLGEFSLLVTVLAISLLSQLGDTLDGRAMSLAASYILTATAAFLVAPCAFRRRSVQRIVWPAMLLGVSVGTLLGEYLGVRDPLSSISLDQGRWRFAGAFYQPNAAGTAGLIGVILACAAFNSTRRWVYLAAVPPLTLVMALADSRGALLAAGAFFAMWAIAKAARWRTWPIAIVSCVAVLVLLGFGMLHSGSLGLPDTSHAQATLNQVSTGRWASWTEALSYLDGPIQWAFGLGLSRNFSFAGRGTAWPVPVRGSDADNFYVDLLGRVGIVGLVLFLSIVGGLALRLCRGLRQASPRTASERALALAVLGGTLVLGATNSGIVTWGWLHAMVAWPLVAAAATRPVYPTALTPPVSDGSPAATTATA